MDVSVSIPLAGTIDDWPAKVQDRIRDALEGVAQREQLPLTIVASACKTDFDVPEDMPGRHYLHVIASEIVVADQRTFLPGLVKPS